jgi:hypothetical protein
MLFPDFSTDFFNILKNIQISPKKCQEGIPAWKRFSRNEETPKCWSALRASLSTVLQVGESTAI